MFSYAFSFLAGILTAISPCVLPVLPLIVGSAVEEHRHAPLSVAAGLIFSFTILGIFLASVGASLGIDPAAVSRVAAIGLILFGVILIVPTLQDKFLLLLAPLTRIANDKLSKGRFKGLTGQFGLGCLLGAVWSPCVGPTLGAAFSLAARGEGLPQATTMMFLFSLGASLPLLLIAYGSRKFFISRRSHILKFGQKAKPMLGVVIVGMGVAILTGLDKSAEAILLNAMPSAWVDLISRY